MSRIASRGLQPVNAVYDTRGVIEDVAYQQLTGTVSGKKSILYDSPVVPKDRSIVVGETAFTKAKGWVDGTPDDPEVRTVLNGLTFMHTGTDKQTSLRKSIRPVGIALKTVVYDTTNTNRGPSDQPVLAVSGQLTTVNTGDKHIEMGQAVQIVLPRPDTKYQYDDKVNYFSANRAVLAYEKLEMNHTFLGEYENNEALRDALNHVFEKAANGDTKIANGFKNSFEGLLNDPAEQIKFDALLAMTRASTMYQLRRYVGTSISGAEKGRKFKCNVQPLTNLVSRAVDSNLKSMT
jgi:hypothetical protein